MELIGSIANQGTLQGQINDANGYLTGVITNAGLLGGQVVAERGLKGDKGETGDTGATGNGIASVTFVSSSGLVDTYKITFTNGTETTFDVTNGQDGIDGVDGHSPVVTASKVGKVTTVSVDGSAIATINDGDDGQDGADGADGYSPSASVSKSGTTATITITDKSGTTTAEIYDGSSGGASAFIAEYGVTTYADVKDAYDEDAIIICICTVDDSGNTAICQLAYYDDSNDTFYFAQPKSDGFYLASITTGDTWDDGYFLFASTDTATQLRDGLMSALDKQKLDTIASGAEVNVQSDWNQSVNTADDYIKNKPTIPSKTSDLNNDSGFITGMTILSYGNSTWQNFIDAYNANRVVYCRAGSGDNPTTAPQTRLAFMAYVNSATPTEVEFQYYRSVSSHSDAQQGDQVYVYKLKSNGTWSVTKREAASKVVAGTNMSSSYSSGTLTLSADLSSKQDTLVSGTNIKTINNTSLLGSGDISVAVGGTPIPTASEVAEFDSSAHINSTDMTSSEVEDFVDELDVSGINAVDYIVEQGTDGIWTYRKWNSGIAECWGKDTQQTKVNNTWGSMFISITFTVSFPTDLFNTPPVTQIYASGGYLCMVNNGNSTPTKDVATYGLFRATAVSTTETYYAHIYARGTWK